MRIKELRDACDPDSDAVVTREKKEHAFAELVQFIDDRSLGVIMRDARDDGELR